MTQEVLVAVLVADGFVPTELALVQDALRIANRLSPNLHFVRQVCSADGEGLIEGKGGLLARAIPLCMDETRLPDHLIVLGGSGVGDGFNKLCARLRRIERMGGNILLLSGAASEWIRRHRDTDRMTTHWEIQQLDLDARFALDYDLLLFPQTSRVAMMLYVRLALSLRNVEDLLYECGIKISHETVRFCGTGSDLFSQLKFGGNGSVGCVHRCCRTSRINLTRPFSTPNCCDELENLR